MESNLEAEPVVPPSVIATRTTIGRVNNNACHYFHAVGQPNENTPDFICCVICTVSGEESDQRASKLVSTIHTQILKRVYLPLIEIPDSENREPISEVLQALYIEVDHENVSLTIAVFISNIVYVSHVGDTRAYFVYDDRIEQITIDRSYIQQLTASQDVRQLPTNALINVRRSQPSGHWEVDTYVRRRYAGGRFVLCTEGLPRLITADEIQHFVMANSLHEASGQLINLARERDGAASITVLIA